MSGRSADVTGLKGYAHVLVKHEQDFVAKEVDVISLENGAKPRVIGKLVLKTWLHDGFHKGWVTKGKLLIMVAK